MITLKYVLFFIQTKLIELLPSQPCILCGASTRIDTWCNECDASLPYLNNDLCPICSLPTFNAEVCGRCLQSPPHYNRTVTVFAYAFPISKLVLALKYAARFQLATTFAKKLVQRISVRPDFIVAMPLHASRLTERGFNQSFQLAYHIGQQLKIPVMPNACLRLRNTPSQSTLPLKERGKNMRKAFSCTSMVSGKHVAIVDDVMTTGATLNELAWALKEAGAIEVSAWVVARTLTHHDH